MQKPLIDEHTTTSFVSPTTGLQPSFIDLPYSSFRIGLTIQDRPPQYLVPSSLARCALEAIESMLQCSMSLQSQKRCMTDCHLSSARDLPRACSHPPNCTSLVSCSCRSQANETPALRSSRRWITCEQASRVDRDIFSGRKSCHEGVHDRH